MIFTPNAFDAIISTYINKPQGAFAELIQNAKQAHASKCAILTTTTTTACLKKNPMLCVLDDGHGMSLPEVKQMSNFGQANTKSEQYLLGYKGFGFKAAIFALCNDALVMTRKHANCFVIASYSMSQNANHLHFKVPTVTLANNTWNGDSMYFELIRKNFGLNKFGLQSLCDKITTATGTMIVMHNLKSNIQLDEAHGDILFPRANSDEVNAAKTLQAYCEMVYLSRTMKIELFGQEIKPFDFSIYTHKAATIEVNKVQFHFATNKAAAMEGWSGFNIYTPDGKSVYCFEKCTYNMRPGIMVHATINMPVKINKLEFESDKAVQFMMHAAYEQYIALYPTSTYKVKKAAVQLPIAIVKQSAVCEKRPRSAFEEEEEIVVFNTCKKTRLF